MTLTPAEQVEPDERLGRLEGVADELVQVEALAEHPAVSARGRVDLGERQHPTPDLYVTPPPPPAAAAAAVELVIIIIIEFYRPLNCIGVASYGALANSASYPQWDGK